MFTIENYLALFKVTSSSASHNAYDCLVLCHWSINTKGHYFTDTGAFCIVSITAIQVSAEDTAKGRQPCYRAGPMHCSSAWASQVSSSTKREKAQSVKTPRLLHFTDDSEELNYKFTQQSLKNHFSSVTLVKCDVIYLSRLPTDINLFGFIIFEASGNETKTDGWTKWETDGCISEWNTRNKDGQLMNWYKTNLEIIKSNWQLWHHHTISFRESSDSSTGRWQDQGLRFGFGLHSALQSSRGGGEYRSVFV